MGQNLSKGFDLSFGGRTGSIDLVAPEVKRGTNRHSAVILLHSRSVILLACVAPQFESVPNTFDPDDQQIEPALNTLPTTARNAGQQYFGSLDVTLLHLCGLLWPALWHFDHAQ